MALFNCCNGLVGRVRPAMSAGSPAAPAPGPRTNGGGRGRGGGFQPGLAVCGVCSKYRLFSPPGAGRCAFRPPPPRLSPVRGSCRWLLLLLDVVGCWLLFVLRLVVVVVPLSVVASCWPASSKSIWGSPSALISLHKRGTVAVASGFAGSSCSPHTPPAAAAPPTDNQQGGVGVPATAALRRCCSRCRFVLHCCCNPNHCCYLHRCCYMLCLLLLCELSAAAICVAAAASGW
jgi:hypothetical protein